MEALVRLIIALVGVLLNMGTASTFPAEPPPPPPPPPMEDVMQQPILIDDVQVQTTRSNPPQITLTVRGTIQDGCDFPVQMSETLDGTAITVTLYRELPADVMCPMMIGSYEGTHTLTLPLEPSTSYTLTLNGQDVPLGF